MIAEYFGTTAQLLQTSSLTGKLSGLIHPKYRLKYNGKIELVHDKIILENWQDIHFKEILSIKCEFDELFGRMTVNGDNRFAFFTKGEPLIITIDNQQIYLLINWRFTTGFTDNQNWFEKIKLNLPATAF